MKAPHRPWPVTMLCALIAVMGILAILHAFSGATAVHGMFHPAIRALACLALFTSLSGAWSMEKWGLVATIASTLCFVGVDILFGAFHPFSMALPLTAFSLLPYWRTFK
ncbi:MAG: hypothetical protein FJX89_04595 [Bacteroidetes bacterium]|nr:hypothetical protein [Bacteroidota bacterium]